MENDHFSLKWLSPYQVGMKLVEVEVNVSDIMAMGGTPLHAVISLCLKHSSQTEFVDQLYQGIADSARQHGVVVVDWSI